MGQFKAPMAHLPAHTKGIVATGFCTGMRRGEILNLTRDKANLKEKKRFSSILIAENPLKSTFLDPTSAKTLINKWCGRGDLNSHEGTPTRP